jgi:rod shape-determining protein MreC
MDDLEVVNASVVSSGVGNFDATIEIDRGANDGVEVGHPVVAGRGLIGQVVRVSDTRSAVRLVTDPKFQVGVRVAGRPGLGIVSGQGNETRLRATSFDLTTELREGDLLVTSGAARSLFPPEVPVGRVTEVTSDEASLQQEADVEIIPRLNDLLYVTVVRWVPDEPRWDEAP